MEKVESSIVWLGNKISWLNLFLVLVTFFIVIFRYLFHMNWVWLQELVLYTHAMIFMTAAAFTLSVDQHVKVDIFYAYMPKGKQAMVRMFGVLVFLWPFCAVMFYNSWPYVKNSWSVFERSGDANGLPGVFLLKTLLLIYPFLLALQGLVIFYQSFKQIRGTHG
ncbi:MAG: TRAP transporter small permease subunit [Bdellovibrionales bacterium]|nr:TRAP transporter small permease subunit [Bdellovibrionales bacterium]